MGWWSACVLGGDKPLDWLGGICAEELGVDNEGGNGYYGYAYTRELLEAHLDEIVAHIEQSHYHAFIGFQVLGAMLLHVGAEIPEKVKVRIIRATEEDEWARKGLPGEQREARRAYMRDLAEKIRNSRPGECVELPQEGLIEKLAKALTPREEELPVLTDAICPDCRGFGNHPTIRGVPCETCDGSGLGNGVLRALERLARYESAMSQWRRMIADTIHPSQKADVLEQIGRELEELRDA